MSECYDCGDLFRGFGECPKCGSQNVGVIDKDEEVDDFDLDDEDLDSSEDRIEDDIIAEVVFGDDEDFE